jgi:hypothetical protein
MRGAAVATDVVLRVIFVTAMINILTILLILFSCRCINTWKITSGLTKYHWFKRYFKWHCYLWYVFLPSVVIHAVLAIMTLGVPFGG